MISGCGACIPTVGSSHFNIVDILAREEEGG